ncbi:MAG: hypothetical protein DHS20C15_08180 [Planctomycetota bacterium]|nr:MAG: hypothetical protein DHS20C15_08180 [Planctomycetota bacterium]
MQAEGLPQRIQRATGDEQFASLDLSSTAEVDAACSALLTRLDETNDFECAALIADLAGAPLAVAAQELANELGLGFSPDDLVVAVLGELMAEMPLQPRRIKHFLGHANDRMRAAAELAVDQISSTDWLASNASSDGQAEPWIAQPPKAQRDRMFQMCFHRLAADDRRLLRLVETEKLPLEKAADILGLSRTSAAAAFDTARLNLLHALEEAAENGRPS